MRASTPSLRYLHVPSRLQCPCAGHVWYTLLDRSVFPEDPRSNKAVVVKMLLDQLLWAPVFSCVFFTFIHLLQVRQCSGRARAVLARACAAP